MKIEPVEGLIVADEFDKKLMVAIDDDQVFAANYVTENETAQNQVNQGNFVMFNEITTSDTVSNIISTITSWIEGLLN